MRRLKETLPGVGHVGLAKWLFRCLWNPSWPLPRGRSRVWVAIGDHFEPLWRHVPMSAAVARSMLWRREWERIAEACPDSTGRPARYTFFYPVEKYHFELVEPLAELCRMGLADLEVHIHHQYLTREGFIAAIQNYLTALVRDHGLQRPGGGPRQFGFIHGDWSLDNSRGGEFCGINEELRLLAELGCYADFTMPSGEPDSQTSFVNRIYRATDTPLPKSYETGRALRPGSKVPGDLLLIPGPFGPRATDAWLQRRNQLGLLRALTFLHTELRLDTGDLASYDLLSRHRVRRWFAVAPRLGNNLFLKLFTHGAQERHSDVLLTGGLEKLYSLVAAECAERGWDFHFVSTWEMYRAVCAIEASVDPVASIQGEESH